MTYAELEENWRDSIGGAVTPGHKKRFAREARIQGRSFEDVQLNYKYCSRGILTRFYVMKGEMDTKPLVPMKNCSEYRMGGEGEMEVQVPSPLWSICTMESHGPSEVKGIPFTPGLYERGIYFRVPLLGAVKPRVLKGKMEITLCFESNEEYLRLWGKLYPSEFRKLNRG